MKRHDIIIIVILPFCFIVVEITSITSIMMITMMTIPLEVCFIIVIFFSPCFPLIILNYS